MKEPSLSRVLILTVGVFIVAGVVRAVAISSLWDWFIAPAFHIPEMPLITALGVSAIASLFIVPPKADTEGKGWGDLFSMMVGQAIVSPLITLAFGWVLHVFFPVSG